MTYIPASIADLAGLRVFDAGAFSYTERSAQHTQSRRFARAPAFPAYPPGGAGRSPFTRAASYTYNHVEAAVARRVDEVQLFLACNAIRKLPLELFTLHGLTVLSLRESTSFRYMQSLFNSYLFATDNLCTQAPMGCARSPHRSRDLSISASSTSH